MKMKHHFNVYIAAQDSDDEATIEALETEIGYLLANSSSNLSNRYKRGDCLFADTFDADKEN